MRPGRHPLDEKAPVGSGRRAEVGPDYHDGGAVGRHRAAGVGAHRDAAGDDSGGGALRREECGDEAERAGTERRDGGAARAEARQGHGLERFGVRA